MRDIRDAGHKTEDEQLCEAARIHLMEKKAERLLEQLEPDADSINSSSAISLKRIADALDRLCPKYEKITLAGILARVEHRHR